MNRCRVELLVALALLGLVACNKPPPAGAYDAVSNANCLPSIALTDQSGAKVVLSSLKGEPALVDFIYTSCPGPCEVLTAKMARVADRLGSALGTKVRIISFSLDPARDNPAALKSFAEKFNANRRGWLFLTGSPATIDAALKGFGVRRTEAPDGTIAHTLTVFLIGPSGRQRRIYDSVQVKPQVMAAEAKALAG
ncbi:MAG TPA: SCO family protein [Candidatus Binataceae bacterium]|nr:SCO family protein [Candidatus Binataceae bacterium]